MVRYNYQRYTLSLKALIQFLSAFGFVTLLSSIISPGSSHIMQSDQDERLNILQWNCRSINTNLIQLNQYLYSCNKKYHVLCLQSLKVKKTDLPALPNYYYPPLCSVEDNKVRTATYILKPLQISILRPIEGVSCDFVEILVSPSESIKIINAYFPTGCPQENMTRWIKDLQGDNVLLVGDFNAHHAMWGGAGTQTLRGGQWLYDHVAESNLCLLNDGSVTRIPDRSDERPSVIDLSFISSELCINTEWYTVDDPLGSDHVPINISVAGFNVTNRQGEMKYDYARANWPEFTLYLENVDYETVNENESLESQYECFRNIVIEAADSAIPKKSTVPNSKYPPNPWWNMDCREAVTIKRRAYKRFKRCQNEETSVALKEARINCKRVIAKAKVLYWRTYLNKNVSNYSDTKILYKHLKRLKQRYSPAERPLNNNGTKTKSNLEKAEVLADTFAKASRSENLSESSRKYRNDEDKKHKDPPVKQGCPLNKKFTMNELRQCIKSVKNNKKATGADCISYRMIQRFPGATLECLLSFFNRCWDAGTMPAAWKQATVVAVPKAGKPPSNPSSYRPISLTPHLGKIYERLIKCRLEYHLQKENVIPLNQAGFQRGRGCSDHLMKLSAHVKKALAKRRTVLSAFYDVQRAYDSVWHGRLLQKLSNIGLSGNLYNFCKSFLSDRSFRVKSGDAVSQPRTVDMGVPQGSIIAPIFFNIMLSDITQVKLKDAQITLYADDLLLFSNEDYKNLKSGYVRQIIMKRFQYNVNQLVTYMKENGFELCAAKTVFMVFNRSRFKAEEYFITIDDAKIYPSTETKFLGVIFDNKLTWKNHITKNIEKTRHVWNLLKMLKRTEGANDVQNLGHTVRALVRSRLLYGHEAFFAASKSVLIKLQTAECKFLRYVLGTGNSTPQEVVYREVGWIPLIQEIKIRTTQYLYRASSIPNSTNEELDLTFDNINDPPQKKNLVKTPRVNARMLSVANYVEETVNATNISRSQIVEIPSYTIPPWELPDLNVNTTLGDYNKTDHLPLLSSRAREIISNDHQNAIHIYTDGSKLENEQVGCAFYIPSLNVKKSYRLNDGVSIMTAEMFSIVMALTFINDLPRTFPEIAVFTDSKSSLESLRSKGKNRREMSLEIEMLIYQLHQKDSTVFFQWIPSHCGIYGNEVVDKAAKDGAQLLNVTNDVKFTVSEAKCKVKKVIKNEWKSQYCNLAQERNWIVTDVDQDGTCPHLTRHQTPVFYRLRAKTYRTQYTNQNCICGNQLSYNHIFSCNHIVPMLADTNKIARENTIPLSPKTLLTKHPTIGWTLVRNFIRELCQTDIGHLI